MSAAELAPQIQTPEQPPFDGIVHEDILAVPTQESQLATQGTVKGVRKLHDKLEKRQQSEAFYRKLGEMTVDIAQADGRVETDELSPHTFMQRRAAVRAIKKAEKIATRKHNLEADMKLYPTTGGSSRVALIKTARARLGAYKEAKKQLADNSEEGIDIQTYRDRREAIGATSIYAGQLSQAKIDKEHRKSVEKLEKKVQNPIMQEVRRSRIQFTQSKIDQLNGISTYDRLADVLFPAAHTDQALQSPEPADHLYTVPLTREERRISAIERLRQMREEGLLPPTTEERPTTEPPEVIFKPTANPLTGEETKPPVETAAGSPAEVLLDSESVEKMAEIAYITAKDEVFRLIDQENDERKASGKDPLSKEEKAKLWEQERSIRQAITQTLTPENRQLVQEKIRQLIKADKEARQAGQEQLRDKRRRETRDKAAADRKTSRSSSSASQRSGETVQQRARREREEKAKKKIEDGRIGFSHPDIPS